MAADPASDQQSRGVVGDDRKDDEERSHHLVRLGAVKHQVIVEGHADVERFGKAHRLSPETLTAAGYEQEGGKASDQG